MKTMVLAALWSIAIILAALTLGFVAAIDRQLREQAAAIEDLRVGLRSVNLSLAKIDRLDDAIADHTRTLKKFGLVSAANALAELTQKIDPEEIKGIARKVEWLCVHGGGR